jgi:phosphohistidine phosphatase SixA
VGVRRLAAVLLACALLAGCGEDDEPARQAPRPDPARELATALRGGGHVLLMRHTRTGTQTGLGPESLESCDQQRNLSAEGREDARAVGAAVRRLRVPIGDVRSSPFCRTRDTARLAFGRVALDRRLTQLASDDPEGGADARRVRALRRLLATAPPAGTNTVLVTHTPNVGAATGLSLLEGETAVFRAGRRGPVGRLEVDDWRRLGG